MKLPRDIFERAVLLRRELHCIPEPAMQESLTSQTICKRLDQLHIPYRSGLAKTGIVAHLKGTDPKGPTVALRADMDALPIKELTGLPFASRREGYMHACGHDGHMAMLIAAAEMLLQSPPKGNVVLIFQPAEESLGGAERMIAAGALKGVDMIFGAHIEEHIPLGTIAYRERVDSAQTDSLDVHIVGKGGHAARPQDTIDAVVLAAEFVQGVQGIVSRGVDPVHPAVITIGKIQAGTTYNVIAHEAFLKGTIRTTHSPTRKAIVSKLTRLARGMAQRHGAKVEVAIHEGYPSIINHPRALEIARQAAMQSVGAKGVKVLPAPSMGGEDFSFYVQKIPGCFARLGAMPKGRVVHECHSPRFDFDERALEIGAMYFANAARLAIDSLSMNS